MNTKTKDFVEAPTDEQILQLWHELEDIPLDPETERIEQPFYIWDAGTFRQSIWGWFHLHYSKGIIPLLYPDREVQ